MTEYAPAAISNMFNLIKAGIPDAILAGIIGDQAHGYGYHRGRNYCGSGDYSCEVPPDREGDGEAACGLDLSWGSSASQFTASQRLMNARNDSRMNPIRSFFGSTDGVNVCGWDYYGGYPVSSDDTHLWHIHVSILRKFATDTNALAAVASVITGGSTPSTDWFDMATQADLAAVVKQQLVAFFATGEGPTRLDQSNGRTRTADAEAVWAANASKDTGTTRATLTDARTIARRAEQAALAAQQAAEACQQLLE